MRDSIKHKNVEAAKKIKDFAKRHIRGVNGDKYTGSDDTKLGLELYKGAHELGDVRALYEMEEQLAGAMEEIIRDMSEARNSGKTKTVNYLERRLRDLEKEFGK